MLRKNYNPMYFLSALGSGGLAVSFYMYLMFLIPHKGVPMTTYDFVMATVEKGGLNSVLTILVLISIVMFSLLHFKLLIWNIKQYLLFKETEGYKALVTSNAEVTKMAIPLTIAMTINVCFIFGAVYVPGLWGVVEYLFPMALIGFAVVGYFTLKMFSDYLARIISSGEFNCSKNNNLSQMISIFAFSMIGVGMAAPGAMSHSLTINAIGIGGAIFFLAISFLLIFIKLILGFKAMFENGIGKEAAPSLWIMIPISTLIGITLVRIFFGLGHHFDKEIEFSSLFTLTTSILSFQIIFGLIGYKVMKSLGYFEEYLDGEEKSPVSFALVCPGVALVVFGMFFINFGLVMNGIVEKYSIAYFILMTPFMYVQYKTVFVLLKLKKKFEL